ncbi:hypothetical protein AJ78_07419 [Emergomyces pasteurianus Ep9510]|uniref:Uncharacterized protein n=1 Tax=Emergomyces pasteurianus Ep9510 TaxID=1447872 RepID=A0A1J9P5D1_9EURO|nr:hypothetical protein AJ78_07419 [Emergomyces pasteurianus Ep9510]
MTSPTFSIKDGLGVGACITSPTFPIKGGLGVGAYVDSLTPLIIISEVNPFARTVISSGIESLNGRLVTCDLNVGFIVGPLRDLPTDDLTSNVLSVLDIRFQRMYHRQRDNNEMAEF